RRHRPRRAAAARLPHAHRRRGRRRGGGNRRRARVTSLWDLMRGAMATKALGVAADLDVAKELAAGPRSVGDLAQATGADPDTLHRILRALVSDGVFAEEEPGVFRNNESSEGLLGDDNRAFAHLFGSVF